MRLVAKLAVSTGVLIAFTTVIVGQKPQTATPPPKTPDMEKVDKIHESVFSKTNKADEASKLTEEMSKALPGAAKVGPVTRRNYIDEVLFSRMDRDKITHVSISADEEVIGRVYMDPTGVLPTADDVRQFMSNKDANKRDQLIDKLVGSKEFAEQWAWYWADLLRENDPAYHYWLKEWLRIDRPYSEVVSDMLTGG